MAAMRLLRDFSLSTVTAGFVAVLVGFSSSVVLVFQAAQAFGATPAILASWMWALGLGVGVCTLVPSLWLRQPVMVAWSTPGAAVLASAGLAGDFSMGEAVGAFMVSAALVIFVGVTGLFSRLMARIPVSLSSALLAGEDGLDVIKPLVRQAPDYLKPEGSLLIEIGFRQGERVKQIFKEAGFESVTVIKDWNGFDRIVKGKTRGSI